MDKYRKVKIVGKGNFGHAVLVQNIGDRKLYIMKVILSIFKDLQIIDVSRMDRKQKEEALNEVHVLKAMRHPYIVTYRESFMDKRCLCIVMDYADGGDMYTMIAKQKQANALFTEDQVLDWFVQMCLAMKHVHDRKILHRDLKTQNIFLTSRGEIKIGDFGIARVLQHTYDCAQTAIGTPYYLSPEICQEKPYNQKSDIWSLGCILYELLTLNHAFDANSMKGLVLKILRGNYPPIPDKYSQNTKDLLADLLIKDPHKRPSIKKILDKEFLSARISSLFAKTVAHQQQVQRSSLVQNPSPVSQEPLTQIASASRQSIDQYPSFEKKSVQSVKEVGKQDPEQEISKVKIINSNKINFYAKQTDQENQEPIVNRQISQPAIVQSQQQEQQKLVIKQKNLIKFTNKGQPAEEIKQPQIQDQNYHTKKPSFTKNVQKYENDDEGNNYSELLSSLQDCLNKKNRKEEDEDTFQEDESQRVYARFLRPDGKELQLPGVSDKDSIAYRIEALRVYLEQSIGDEILLSTYDYLHSIDDSCSENDNNQLNKMMGSKIKFLPLIYQMIVCEDSYYLN